MSQRLHRGPHGGALSPAEHGCVESLAPELLEALLAAQGAPRAMQLPLDEGAATVVPFTFEPAVGARFDGPLHTLHPFTPAARSRAASLDALTRVANALNHLHARGIVHGDLRPASIVVDEGGAPTLLVPTAASAPGALLRARLHPGGEDPAAAGFVSPEVLAGVEATPASDVYSLAALTYAALTGFTPVGQVNLRPFAPTPAGALAACVESALNQSPAMRPATAALAGALSAAATAATSHAAPPQPYRAASQGAPDLSALQRDPSGLSPLLMLVLVVGGLCAFLGAVLLVVAGWDVVGQLGRVALLAGLSALALGAGQLAASRRLTTGALVARALAALFGVVAVGYSFYLLNEPGRLGLLIGLCALSCAGGALAMRRSAPFAGGALLTLGSQLVWAIGAQWIHMRHPTDRLGAVCALAAVVSVGTYGLAIYRRSLALGALGALNLAVFLGTFGSWLDRGTVFGSTAFSLVCAAVALAFARLATALGGGDSASPYAGGAVVAAGVSVLTSLSVLSQHWITHGVQAAAWPYLVVALGALASLLAPPAGSGARAVALATLALAPTCEALVRDEPGFAVVAVVVGLALLIACVRLPALQSKGEARTELIFAALVGVMASPDLRVLHAIDRLGREGDLSRMGWITMGVASLALVGLSYALTGRVRREQHRLLELAALGQLFALLTLRVLADDRELAPAVAALGGAALTTALGALTRRAWVMLLGAAALGVNVWIQYFVRLAEALPLSVRLVGFGVALLLSGVIYEQKLRHQLAALREWD